MHLYFHIPFCISKCDYCDFYSLPNKKTKIPDYFHSMNLEIEEWLDSTNLPNSPIKTIYFGGGTPSIAPVFEIGKILNNLKNKSGFAQTIEVTLEMNPGEISRQKLAEFFQIGINRISIGCQSFLDADLSNLGRIHSSKQALQVVELAKDVGFQNIGLDLIFGIPEQTFEDWKRNLTVATNLDVQHLSVYNLTPEKGTKFYESIFSGDVKMPDEIIQERMFLLAQTILAEGGFEQYEISNYAKKGFRSQHNANYWSRTDYRGFGPSAHSFVDGKRFWNVRDLEEYTKRLLRGKSPIDSSEILSSAQKFTELVMMGLRTARGISMKDLKRKKLADQFFQNYENLDAEFQKKFIVNSEFFKLEPEEWLLCDSLIEKLLAEI
ncbi:radical SAM family heme chaperone HemW [bacterium]|nr:radical SAM family heme chaperone HemW [bacterium]